MIIELRDVEKWFGQRCALKMPYVRLRPEQLLVIGGPNGAGKSVMLKLLAGIIQPTQGVVLWNGRPVRETLLAYKFRTGYMPQQPSFYEDHTVAKCLRYFSQLKAIPNRFIGPRVATVMDQVRLTALARRRIKNLSGGERSRLALGVALLNDPDVLLLDEPGANLDPHERLDLWALVAALRLERTIVLATHVYAGLEGIADRLLVLDDGCPIWDDAVETLLKTVAPDVWSFTENADVIQANWADPVVVVGRRHTGSENEWRVIASERPAEHASNVSPTLQDAYLWVRWQKRASRK